MGINVADVGSTESILKQSEFRATETPDKLYIPQTTSRYLYDLDTPEYELKSPLQVILIREEDGSYTFQHPFLGLWAESKNLSRAEKSLKQKILYLYKKLKTLPKDELGPFPEDCLIYLENRIV